ncbi:MAG: hypothetical protein ACRDOS_07885 [Gaiellaceae bacterium]
MSVRQPIHRVRFLDERRAQAASVSVDEQVERMVKTIPLGRYGDPAELGRVAAFLLSPAASLRPATWTTTEPEDPASAPLEPLARSFRA